MKQQLFVIIFIVTISFAHGQQWTGNNTTTDPISRTGSIGLGISPVYKLDVYGPANDFKARFQGPDGYITIGPANSGWAHIYTDRPAFIFNQSVWSFPGVFSSFNTSDLSLQTNGTTRLTISNATGNVGVGQANPYSQSRLHIKSPSATPWGLITEASGNGKIIGLGHDGTTGYISTSYLDASGYSPLSLQTSNTNRLFIAVDGKVGIGTNAPQNNFEVLGSGQILRNTIASDYTSLRLYNNQNNLMRALEIDYSGSSYGGTLLNSGPTGESASIGTTGAYPLVFGTSNTARMTITSGGNVGVGTYSPDEKLTVKGKIHTEEVRVDLSVPAPDYVFEKDYDLTPLSHIEKFIQANKHLPEVPSAKQMEQDGVNLKEMNMILLKKIEELTLHLIEKDKKLTEVEKRLEQLEEKLRQN